MWILICHKKFECGSGAGAVPLPVVGVCLRPPRRWGRAFGCPDSVVISRRFVVPRLDTTEPPHAEAAGPASAGRPSRTGTQLQSLAAPPFSCLPLRNYGSTKGSKRALLIVVSSHRT